MAKVFPFRGFRYDPAVAGPAARTAAPPYDVISAEEQKRLHDLSPFNAIRLEYAYDDPPGSRPARAREAWDRWIAQGALKRDKRPLFYALEQTFKLPSGETRARRGIVAAVRIEGPEVIVPHEKTLSGPRADRLAMMKAIPANLSPVFCVFSDPGRRITSVAEISLARPGAVAFQGEDGVGVRFGPIEDAHDHRTIRAVLGDKELFIADGHHRFATAQAYRDLQRAAHPDAPEAATFGHVLMALVAVEDPGLVVLPYDRGVEGVPGFTAEGFLGALAERFDVARLPSADEGAFLAEIAKKGAERPSFGVAFGDAARTRVVASLRPGLASVAAMPEPFRDLDYALLNKLVFEEQLGVTAEQVERGETLRFFKSHAYAFEALGKGLQAAFIMNATRVEQVMTAGRAGLVMPQKSTFFYPKLPTGLVFNPLPPGETLE